MKKTITAFFLLAPVAVQAGTVYVVGSQGVDTNHYTAGIPQYHAPFSHVQPHLISQTYHNPFSKK